MTDVKDLVSIDEGVRGDATMNQFHQLLRVDLVRATPATPTKAATPVKAQVMYSRVNVDDPKQRRNQYVSYSLPSDMIKLGLQFLAAGMTLMVYGDRNVDLSHAVANKLRLHNQDIVVLIRRYMEGLK